MKNIVFIFFVLILVITGCESEELIQIKVSLEQAKQGDKSPIKMSDTIGLPNPVKKYFEFSGVEGTNRVRFVKFKTDGKLN